MKKLQTLYEHKMFLYDQLEKAGKERDGHRMGSLLMQIEITDKIIKIAEKKLEENKNSD